MRSTRTVTTLILAGGWLLFAATQAAQAGFICASVDRGPAAELAEAASMSAPAEADERSREPITEILMRQHVPWLSPPGSTGGSTSGNSLTSSPGGAPVAVLTTESHARSTLITRLAPDRPLWLPPPFSTGVFRPPRFVG